MNPILQFFLKALVSAGDFLISMLVTLIRQPRLEGGCVELILDRVQIVRYLIAT
jgi:hypothetical protein